MATLYGYTGLTGLSMQSDGGVLQPPYTFSSETSLGLYRSGASQLQLSYGSFVVPSGASLVVAGTATLTGTTNATGTITLTSAGNVVVSSLTTSTSLSSLNIGAASGLSGNDAFTFLFFIGGASGASFGIRSGSTTYIFGSSLSTK